MPCACMTAKKYEVTRPDGSKYQYGTESQAAADVRRNGGTYTAVS